MKKLIFALVIFILLMQISGAFALLNLKSGGLSYWKLDELIGQTATDELELHNWSVQGNWTTAGKINGGYFCKNDSVDTGINLTRAVNLTAGAGFAINFWYNRTGFIQGQAVMFTNLGAAADYDNMGLWSIIVNTQDKLFSYIYPPAGVNLVRNAGGMSLIQNVSYMITLVINSTNASLYVNGSNLGSATPAEMGVFSFVGTNISAFSYGDKDNRLNNSIIDEVGIWNRTLTSNEITSLYNNRNGLSYDSFVVHFEENYQTYNNITMEGNKESFSINLSYDSSFYSNILANLIYNGTSYVGIKTGSGNSVVFNKTLNIPFVDVDTNLSFYWQVGLINSTGTFYVNSSFHNQTVNNLGFLDDCSSYQNLVLNYTLKDERTQNLINATEYNTSIELDMQVYPIGSSNLLLNLSKLYNGSNIAKVCISSNLTNTSQYSMYVQAKYYGDLYVTRYNYLQNFILQNSTMPQNINLFDLQTTYATQFLISYKDATFLAVSNAIVSISKKYVSEGVFKTIDVAKTDNLGQATSYFDLSSSNEYRITISKDGTLLSTFDNIAIFCEDKATGNCQISLDAGASTTPVNSFYTFNNLLFVQDFNETIRVYSLSFSTYDNSVDTININLTKFDGYGNTVICANSVTTSSGVLTCNVPASYNNVTFIAGIYYNGELIGTTVFSITNNTGNIFTGNIVVILILFIISIGMMLIPSAIGLIIGTLVGLGFGSYLLFVNGVAVTGGIFIMLIIAGLVIIWRIRQGGSE